MPPYHWRLSQGDGKSQKQIAKSPKSQVSGFGFHGRSNPNPSPNLIFFSDLDKIFLSLFVFPTFPSVLMLGGSPHGGFFRSVRARSSVASMSFLGLSSIASSAVPAMRGVRRIGVAHAEPSCCAHKNVNKKVKEPSTGVEFDGTVEGLKCVGAGVRVKKIGPVRVKVYAVALYVDANGAKAANDAENLMTGSYERKVVVKLVRNVKADTFWGALADALRPRMGAKAFEGSEASKKLKDFFHEAGKLENGSAVTLHWKQPSELCVGANGKKVSIASKELATALFDVYLGKDPVSPPALKSFKEGIQKL